MENVLDMVEGDCASCRIVIAQFITEGFVLVMKNILFVMSTVAVKKASPINYSAQSISITLSQ